MLPKTPLLRAALFALIAGLAVGCSHCTRPTAASSAEKPLTIIYTTALVGNLEPCGCSSDQRGGIARAAAAIEQIRKEGRPVLVIDGGDRFFPDTPASTDPLVRSQQERQAASMAAATQLMGYDALAFGTRDAQGGQPFLSRPGMPPLLDTGDNSLPFTKPSLLKNVEGVSVGLFAAEGGASAAEVIRSRAAALRAQGAQVIVLMAYRSFEKAKELLPVAREAGVSIVLAGRADEPETHDSAVMADSSPPLFTVSARGQALLRIDLLAGGSAGEPFVKVAGQGERDAELEALQQRIAAYRAEAVALAPTDPMAKLKTDKLLELESRKAKLAAASPPSLPAGKNVFTYAFVPMSQTLPQDPKVREVIDHFDSDVGTANLAYAKAHPKDCPAAAEGQPVYVGDQKCQECHQSEVDFWKTTAHSHAYQSLASRNKQYNVACIRCHVVGYEKPGGACDIATTAGRQNVQCESCHGPGSLHAENGDDRLIRRQVPETQCRTCHDPENSTHFNYTTYLTQILGPGHPASKK
jgi:hypothetical protein